MTTMGRTIPTSITPPPPTPPHTHTQHHHQNTQNTEGKVPQKLEMRERSDKSYNFLVHLIKPCKRGSEVLIMHHDLIFRGKTLLNCSEYPLVLLIKDPSCVNCLRHILIVSD